MDIPTTVTLDSSTIKRPHDKPLLDLYKWLVDIYTCVTHAILKKDHRPCDDHIDQFQREVRNGKDQLTIAFDKPANNQEKILQEVYQQKIQLRQKLFVLLADEIVSSWKAFKAIAGTINVKTQEIDAKAEATRAYFHAYLDQKVKPLVEGRKLVAEDRATPTVANKEYDDQKHRCDAALKVMQDLQQKHRAFWQTTGSQADLVKLREIQTSEKAAMKKLQEETDRMVAVRRKMLETTTDLPAASFLLHEPAEEAEQYLRDFQRIVEEECNCYKYRIMEYQMELDKVAKQEIQRIRAIVKDVKKQEETMMKRCDDDIALVEQDTKRNDVLQLTRQKMQRAGELVMRRKVFQVVANGVQEVVG